MPTCTTASLFESNIGFSKSLSPTQQKAAAIYLMALELAALGGTDYTSVMTTTLVEDANSVFEKATPDQYALAALNIAYNNAVAAGATVPDTINEINAATGCCFQGGSNLDAIYLFLMCQLGQHATQ